MEDQVHRKRACERAWNAARTVAKDGRVDVAVCRGDIDGISSMAS